MLELYRTFAQYSRWMNGKLYEVCATFSDEERKLQRGAPFGSMHGNLNHTLLADKVWLARFTGEIFVPKSLADEVHSDYDDLRAARHATDDGIEAYVNSLSEEQLGAPFTYRSFVIPRDHTFPLWFCLAHMFNHQTHHRGQLTALIEQAGGDCGVSDFLQLPVELREF